ncbi:MAG TPA: hypothetical protein VL201_04985 [Patescibacteria group bacterium]|jgi:large subunit ribosomal protein L6|nr:hypothetical protein [Patescibacteria group bacterium]
MSKIGRKPIAIDGIAINVEGQGVYYKGPKSADVYTLPDMLTAIVKDKQLFISVKDSSSLGKVDRNLNCIWGLHHALLKNRLLGSVRDFEKKIKIVGLGCKAEFVNRSTIKEISNKKYVIDRDKKTMSVLLVGDKQSSLDKGLLFTLGKSHLFYFALPMGVSVEIDKSGQNLILRAIDPVMLGLCVSKIKQLRKPEPYKGTGIREETEVIRRKAGKTKAG